MRCLIPDHVPLAIVLDGNETYCARTGSKANTKVKKLKSACDEQKESQSAVTMLCIVKQQHIVINSVVQKKKMRFKAYNIHYQ